MNCPNCKRPLATDHDYATMNEGDGQDLCWMMWGDTKCESIAQSRRDASLATMEMIQAAIDEGCDILIQSFEDGTVDIEIRSIRFAIWDSGPTLESAMQKAWKQYQENKQ